MADPRQEVKVLGTGLVLMRMGIRCMLRGGVPRERVESEFRERVEQYVAEKHWLDEADAIHEIVQATDLAGSGRLN